MMTQTAAIVLRCVRYGEAALVVDLLTEQMGRVSFLVRLAKTGRGKMRRNLFQPLSMLEVDFDYRPKAGLQRLSDVRMAVPLPSVTSHPHKTAVGMFIAEFLAYATRDESDNALLYQYVEHSLRWLDGVEEGFANFHLVFMMRLSRFVGLLPNTDDYAEGDFFDMLNGCFCGSRPDHAHFLPPHEAKKISLLMRLEYPTMHLCAMSREERHRCTDVILQFYRLHVPGFPELRSYAVLKQLFD